MLSLVYLFCSGPALCEVTFTATTRVNKRNIIMNKTFIELGDAQTAFAVVITVSSVVKRVLQLSGIIGALIRLHTVITDNIVIEMGTILLNSQSIVGFNWNSSFDAKTPMYTNNTSMAPRKIKNNA